MSRKKLCIGISQCLTNSIVRYDAKSQFNEKLIDELSLCFELVTICPEVECGLGVPRPAVELVETDDGVRIMGRDNKMLDVSDELISYSNSKVLSLAHLSGYVFKAHSPSCGVNSTPIFDSAKNIKRLSNGVFVDALLKQYPVLPVMDDGDIFKKEKLSDFINAVKKYAQG